jgi:hypothetical protein
MSKAARFRSRLTRAGLGSDVIRKLVCPIGVDGIDSKWPAAIAVSVAAQLMQQISAPPHTHRAPAEMSGGEASGVGVIRAEASRAGVSRPEAAHVELAATELARAEGRRGERAGADPACAPENCATCGTTPSRRGTVTS